MSRHLDQVQVRQQAEVAVEAMLNSGDQAVVAGFTRIVHVIRSCAAAEDLIPLRRIGDGEGETRSFISWLWSSWFPPRPV